MSAGENAGYAVHPAASRLTEWRPWRLDNPALLGHATITFAGGLVVHQIPVFRSRDGLGVGVPTAAQLDADGRIKLRDGKRQYSPILSFESASARERWRNLVLAALAAGGIEP